MVKYVRLLLVVVVLGGCADHPVLINHPTAAEATLVDSFAKRVKRLRWYWDNRPPPELTIFRKSDGLVTGGDVRRRGVKLLCDMNRVEFNGAVRQPHLKQRWVDSVTRPFDSLVREFRADLGSHGPSTLAGEHYVDLAQVLADKIRTGQTEVARGLLETARSTYQVPPGHRNYWEWKRVATLVPGADLPQLDALVAKEWEGVDLCVTGIAVDDIVPDIWIEGHRYGIGDLVSPRLKIVSINSWGVEFDYRGFRVNWPW